jgi:hypothetical protein
LKIKHLEIKNKQKRTQTKINVYEGVGKKEPSYTAGRNVN